MMWSTQLSPEKHWLSAKQFHLDTDKRLKKMPSSQPKIRRRVEGIEVAASNDKGKGDVIKGKKKERNEMNY